MTPEKYFDYLEGKLSPDERARLERALISNPELQREFVTARQIHRSMQRPADESAAVTRAGSRGRQLAAAFAVLVLMNVALGLIYIFRANQPRSNWKRRGPKRCANNCKARSRNQPRRPFLRRPSDGKSALEIPRTAGGGGQVIIEGDQGGRISHERLA
jgi:hypothetical protein